MIFYLLYRYLIYIICIFISTKFINFIEKEFPKLVNTIEVNLLENEDNFTDDEWNNLYKLSEETFVEESDSLKEGAAGAGLTDND